MTTRSWATAQTACWGEGAARRLSPGRLGDGRAAASPAAVSDLTLVMARVEVAVLAFGQDHWLMAWTAFLRYGKGRHPAGLNFGNCLTYAVARLSGLPLLCVGSDFAQTGLMLVPLSA